jgi:hypothetical protein
LNKSIKRWGFLVPIITNKEYLIADVEHRLEAAKKLGMKQVSVIKIYFGGEISIFSRKSPLFLCFPCTQGEI